MDNEFNKYKLDEKIIKALNALGYTKATKVQEAVITKVFENKDLIVKSQTGTGKTAAFVIPLCEKIKWEENLPEVLVLTPTRELAVQIGEDIKNIGRYKRIKSVCIYGKSPYKEQVLNLKGKTHMVVGTPGRVLDHLNRKTLNVENIKYLVIDEADEMLNMGFIKEVKSIIQSLPKMRVNLLFSATISDEIKELCKSFMKNEETIEIQGKTVNVEKIENVLYRTDISDKLVNLNKILINEVPKSAVVFCKTKENVDLVYEFLKQKQYCVGKIHGGLLQQDRLDVMDKFKKGEFRILIATDVAARGIDVEGISHVINYDLPVEKESYVHRIGRTARAGKKGKAISLVTKFEDSLLNIIEEYINFKIKELNIEHIEISKEKYKEAEETLRKKAIIKNTKSKILNKDIMKLYFNGGKKKKIRAIDFVGTICNLSGINSEDIGIIDIQDNGSYVEILNGKGNKVLNALKNTTIKGKKLKVEKARK